MTSIREVERQIEKTESRPRSILTWAPLRHASRFRQRFKLMAGMLTMPSKRILPAWRHSLVTHEGTSRAYRELGIDDGHHPLTRHRNQVDMMDKVTRINTYHVEQFSKWMQRMKATQEASGSVLDNSMIVYGAGLADPNNHIHDNLPTMIVEVTAVASVKTGRNVVYRMGNAHVQSVPINDGSAWEHRSRTSVIRRATWISSRLIQVALPSYLPLLAGGKCVAIRSFSVSSMPNFGVLLQHVRFHLRGVPSIS